MARMADQELGIRKHEEACSSVSLYSIAQKAMHVYLLYPCSITVYRCEIQSCREGETGAEGEWADKGTRGSGGEI